MPPSEAIDLYAHNAHCCINYSYAFQTINTTMFMSPSVLEYLSPLILYLVVLGSVIGMATNGTILSQIILYKKPEAAKEKKTE